MKEHLSIETGELGQPTSLETVQQKLEDIKAAWKIKELNHELERAETNEKIKNLEAKLEELKEKQEMDQDHQPRGATSTTITRPGGNKDMGLWI
ncbi:hypothetical protein TWF694_008232 [Orbilia ellipsospora]|uniref:Uncharacterized protein n=1 Tax=Orbilia ellipsospora TaxID=2528407 RepID=A0AAV9XFG5_9PEZI